MIKYINYKKLFVFILVSMPMVKNVSAEETSDRGAEIYHDYCSVCHGDKGDGNSRAKDGLITPPRDFTLPGLGRVLSRQNMIDIVKFGRDGTAMAGWSTRLSDDEVGLVVDYIRNNYMSGNAGKTIAATQPVATNHNDNDKLYVNGLKGNGKKGKQFYDDNCATCHGISGNGDGPRAYFIFPKPRNFLAESSRQRLNRSALFYGIKYGVAGKEMPAWGKVIDDQTIANVAEYVYSNMIRPE